MSRNVALGKKIAPSPAALTALAAKKQLFFKTATKSTAKQKTPTDAGTPKDTEDTTSSRLSQRSTSMPYTQSGRPPTPKTQPKALTQASAISTPNPNEQEYDSEEDEIASGLTNAHNARMWMVNQELLDPLDEVPSLDSLAAILLSFNRWTDTTKGEIITTAKAIGLILQLLALDAYNNNEEEEGEIDGTEPNQVKSANTSMITEMKHLLQESEERMQDRVDRAIKALEDTAKDLKQQVIAQSTPPSTYSQIAATIPPPPAPHANTNPHQHPFTSRPPGQQTGQFRPNDQRIREREITRARQLVLDIDADHAFAKASNVGIRDDCRKALKLANAPVDFDIHSVSKLRKGGILLETNKVEAAEWLKEEANSNNFRKQIKVNVDFTKRTYSMIVKFVQVNFDPDDERHIRELKEDNCWDGTNFVKARWAKPIERRNPHQTHAHLIVNLKDENEVNSLIHGRGYIHLWGRRLQVEKDKRSPVRCAKCQIFGHFASECLQQEDTCARCAAKGHKTQDCNPGNTVHCANCKIDGHEAYSNTCPTYQKKQAAYNERTPENNLPYYPSHQRPTNDTSPPLPSL